ncbi:hypothetical protein D8S78_12560 [Natrialba swarupiae]|nr:hypothetical protein [Natrialba swarupiae]
MTESTPITSRDTVWDAVLFHLAYTDSTGFKRSDLDLPDNVSTNTEKRTLQSMRALGWLKKESEQAHTWQPSDRLLFLAAGLRHKENNTTQIWVV